MDFVLTIFRILSAVPQSNVIVRNWLFMLMMWLRDVTTITWFVARSLILLVSHPSIARLSAIANVYVCSFQYHC